jgi:nucleoside-diphosphate-sugar epimerase
VHLLRMHRRADCSKARQELGYMPTSVKEAVREAHAWFQRAAASGAPSANAVTETEGV